MPIRIPHTLSIKRLTLASVLGLCATMTAHAETTLLLSATSGGAPGNAASDRPSISADGRYVAFQSAATNLAAADSNVRRDIFLLDRQSGSITRASKGILGAESNGDSQAAAIASAGRYIAFESTATNLVTSDSNIAQDVFVYDTSLGTTMRASVSTGGTAGNAESFKPQLSSNGRFVVFMSYATNLVAGDSNVLSDVFLHDRDPDANGTYDEGNGTTVRASVNSGGAQLLVASDFPSISADGRYVAFSSGSGLYVYDRLSGTTENLTSASNGTSTYTSLSSDGRYVAFASVATNLVASDTNLTISDIFVHDRTLSTTTLASVSQSGTQSAYDSFSPAISADGRYVAFVTEAGALTTRRDRIDITFDAISAATGGGGGGGGTTTYYAYRRDRTLNTTVRASSGAGGATPNASSGNIAINSDGTFIAFSSLGSNLTCATDGNAAIDVFLRDLRTSTATPSCGASSASTSAAGGAFDLYLLLLASLMSARRVRLLRDG